MTSRERVRTALNHREPDKLPIDCGSMRSTGIMAIAYNDLKAYLGIREGRTRVYDAVQQLAVPEEWFLKRFRVDSVDLARSYIDEVPWRPWTLPDGSSGELPGWLTFEQRDRDWVCLDESRDVVGRMAAGAAYFSQTIYPYAEKDDDDFSDLDAAMAKSCWSWMTDPLWADSGREGFPGRLRAHAKALHEQQDRAVMIGAGCNLFEWGQFLYRTDNFLVNLMTDRKTIERALDELVDRHLATLAEILPAIDPYVDVVQVGDDLGMQGGPMISPELYREVFLPRHTRIFRFIRDRSQAQVFLHSCGSIYDLIPALIDAGVQILNPVQVGATHMDPVDLKREYGKDLTFWGGGVDTQHVLPNGTPQQVADEVRRNAEVLMRDGGFVFNQVHNIVAGVPPQNVVAMYEAANAITY